MPSSNLTSEVATIRSSPSVADANGKLGVMMPGMGAVATTFVAGVEAVRMGIALPIGSMTQMGTVRLGKHTEGRSPKIKELVPLANLGDLVFGGWDIFEDDMYEAASKPRFRSSRFWRRLSRVFRPSSLCPQCSTSTT